MDRSDVDVAVIGAGFGGLGMAIRLRRDGLRDFVVLERAPAIGGTWWANTYPGLTCDVPSHLYSFSFAPNPEWSATYSPQPEIRAYLERCADEHGVRPHLRCGTDVEAAAWDEAAGRWRLSTSRGPLTARVLVAASGPLTEPRIPALPGLDTFRGRVFHSARWDHGHPLDGARVAAIGTGASAIQFVPAIQPRVARLHVFQRTPPWVLPHTNRRISERERRLYRAVPAAQKATRAGVYAQRELLVPGFTRRPALMKAPEALARRHLRAQVRDPALRARLRPDYALGCKRILPSNAWYPALQQDNVELVSGAPVAVEPHAVVGADGFERPVDTIIFGTGFKATDPPLAHVLRGRGGRLLSEAWAGSPRAYLGTTAAGFPNLFLLLGPNTGLGHSSMIYMIESQVAYVADALRVLARDGAAVAELRPAAQRAYAAEIDRRMRATVWSTGCSSWYLDATGRNAALWPDWTWRFRRRTRRFDPARYELRGG
jgi:cation diffusion facilitator CzcD-associated flavoprotein CzcO